MLLDGDSIRGDAFAHAADTLELGAVLADIAGRCHTLGGGERVRRIAPTNDVAVMRSRQRNVSEVRAYHQQYGNLSIADTAAAAEWLERASEHHDIITPEGLLAIRAAEAEVVKIRRRFDDDDEFPNLREIVSAMTEHADLVRDIDAAIDRDAAVRDGASRKLKGLRSDIHRTRDDIRRYSDRAAKTAGSAEYATFNGARYMLLLPREKCRGRDGIVHGASQTGGSLYFEPFELVQRNNKLETLLADEREEVARILAELTSAVLARIDELRVNLDVWARLDALGAIARYADAYRCIAAEVSDDDVHLKDARHPLLERSLQRERGAVVPLTLRLTSAERVLVITGPNAGGKTVALKTVGLLVLMNQCGLPVPAAEGSTLCVFDRVLSDIGDEQSIETSLSTFTSHLRHLDTMCRTADAKTLCLIDEIGDGTDPDEGSALAIAALEHLLAMGAAVVATTHYGKIKTFALDTKGVSNASMRFDDGGDRPLYQMLQGTAGQSRGIATARRLDFCRPVIERAAGLVGADTFRLESLLAELESGRVALARERDALHAQSQRLGDLIRSYEAKDAELKAHAGEHRERARQEAEELLRETRREVESLVKRIRETSASKEAVREGHRAIEELMREAKPAPAPAGEPVATVAVGDRVSLSPSGEPAGTVVDVSGKTATVEIGGKRIRTGIAKLYPAASVAGTRDAGVTWDVDAPPLDTTTLDVRGQDREAALAAVDRFLDAAVLGGASQVTIIHGVGEGVLQAAIRSYLESDRRVKSARPGGHREGGAGVSIVILR